MPPRYAERLLPPWWSWLLVAAFVLTLGLVLLAVGPLVALLSMAGAAVGCVGGLLAWSAVVEVTGGELRAGRAHIPVVLLGEPVPLDAQRAGELRGPSYRPMAYHLLRGWVPTAVVVDVLDPADPTPYWYVSTRRPVELAEAIATAQADQAGRTE